MGKNEVRISRKRAYVEAVHRALRGGSWNNDEDNLRCSARINNNPDIRNNNIGFRVLRCQLCPINGQETPRP